MKVIGIGGEPGTGKSEIMRGVLNQLPRGQRFKQSFSLKGSSRTSIEGTRHLAGSEIWILGVYDDQSYPGTDRLSMSSPAILMDFLTRLNDRSVVLFEGQRFFRLNLVERILDRWPESRFWVLNAHSVESRRAARKDTKPQSFIRAARTQARNVLTVGPPNVIEITNEDICDLECNVGRILSQIG